MSEPTGHAAFHLLKEGPTHSGTDAGTKAQRRAVLKESMRHLDPKDVARHARKNPSIVSADSHLNTAFVNDGEGGFGVASAVGEVIAYGNAREGAVRRKISKGWTTVNLFVVHLPKTLCVEIEDYYPRVHRNGQRRLDPITGEPMSRSRWLARDRDEAMRYFADAVAFLSEHVIPGGQAAIHGWATNFDETTPHIQLMADPFAPDPKAPATKTGALRTEQNQAYGEHRERRDANDKLIHRRDKFRRYQAEMREHMLARGWPVEKDPGPRHGKGQSNSEYQDAQDERADAAAHNAAAQEAEARAEAAQADARRTHEAAFDLVADMVEAQQVGDHELELEREEMYGELGAEHAKLRRKEQQVDDVLTLERQIIATERAKEKAEFDQALERLASQNRAAACRERAAEERERDAAARKEEASTQLAELQRKLADVHKLFLTVQHLGRATVELAKAGGVRLPAAQLSRVKQARVAHDELVRRVLSGSEDGERSVEDQDLGR